MQQSNLHNPDDLVLIVRMLQSQDPFRILCGCVALEKFLQEESNLEKLEFQ